MDGWMYVCASAYIYRCVYQCSAATVFWGVEILTQVLKGLGNEWGRGFMMGAGVGFFVAAVKRKRDWEHHGTAKHIKPSQKSMARTALPSSLSNPTQPSNPVSLKLKIPSQTARFKTHTRGPGA